MAESTFFGSSLAYSGPPQKRKRLTAEGMNQAQPSEIPDHRIMVSKALRLDCDTINVRVGLDESQETFKVHEDALCDRSEFFRSAMKPEWASQRADSRTVDLPEDDPEAFSLYRTWLYTGKLPVLPEHASGAPSPPGGDPSEESYHVLAYAYVLGERLMDVEFKNAIADAYVLYARGAAPGKRHYPSNEEIRIIYEGTTEACPLRKLLVDIWYCRGKAEWIEQDPDAQELPKEFLLEVVKALLKLRTGVDNLSRPWKNNHEQYHEKVQ
ncbi:hypothetical protein BS50DRAFT_577772 [Corynespora cassiicola Philippines]|uniref:BTB domain-containing protein n=1 Tax=Corynespora cassiicola Philippines TaxID=1448308 RepID=A0A2T2NBR3_CORCC|nr:hypothetical protein BS50DRAFT_577772 [Corynespora cassiicola Philippines]